VFSFTLPINRIADAEPLPEPTLTQGALLEKLAGFKLNQTEGPKTVLIVDDEPHVRELLRQELEAGAYTVLEAGDGRTALNMVRATPPDLIILDVAMPELSGFDVAAVLKRDPQTRQIPIIVLSVVQDTARGYSLGVDRYLTKPIEMPELLAEVKALIAPEAGSRRVLVIEEEAETRANLQAALEAQGWQVEVADTVAGGVQVAEATRPAIVVANAAMAEGQQLPHLLRVKKGLTDVSFLLFT
jgi:DNA-binding response OmpR family regulator